MHRPTAAAATNMMDKVADDFRAARRMDDLGMKLKAVKLFGTILECGEGRVVTGRDAFEAFGQLR